MTCLLRQESPPPWIKTHEKNQKPRSSLSYPKKVVSHSRPEFQDIQRAQHEPLSQKMTQKMHESPLNNISYK